MPTINLKPIKHTERRGPSKDVDVEERRKIRRYVYTSERWAQMRRAKLMEQPLCERCLEQGETVLAEDVHHIESFAQHLSNWRAYAYDYANLMSLCKTCHGTIHKQQQQEDDT